MCVIEALEKDVFEPNEKGPPKEYKVFHYRWLILGTFVLYSASSSLQWTQYSIIQDTVVKYYGVSSSLVYWTTMVFSVTYIPMIFPACWLMDKAVCICKRLFVHESNYRLATCNVAALSVELDSFDETSSVTLCIIATSPRRSSCRLVSPCVRKAFVLFVRCYVIC